MITIIIMVPGEAVYSGPSILGDDYNKIIIMIPGEAVYPVYSILGDNYSINNDT